MQHAAFALFDKDGNGDITRKEMREAVRRIYRERKALTASLKDVGSAVAKLDAVLLAVTLLIPIFVRLLTFNRGDTIALLVPLATIILGFSLVLCLARPQAVGRPSRAGYRPSQAGPCTRLRTACGPA